MGKQMILAGAALTTLAYAASAGAQSPATAQAPAAVAQGPMAPGSAAQTAKPAESGPPASVKSATGAVTSYPASFFTDAHPNTAYDMIGRLPAFSFDAGASERGFAGTAGNVLIDGRRPTSKSDSLDTVLSRVLFTDVDHIDVIRGGAPGIDMQGWTVVANVVLKTGDKTQWVVAGGGDIMLKSGNRIPSGRLEYHRTVGQRTYSAALYRYASMDDSVGDGRLVQVPTGGDPVVSRAHTYGQGGGLAFHGDYKGPLAGGQLSANLLLEETYFKSGVDYDRLDDPDIKRAIDDRDRDHDGELGLHYDRDFGKLHLETLALQRLGRDRSGEIDGSDALVADYRQLDHTGETIGRATLRYTASPKLTLETGAEGAYNFLKSDIDYSENGADIPLPSANVKVQETRGELFATATWKPLSVLTVEAGARFEASRIKETGDADLSRTFFYPKPRLVVTWTPDPASQLRFRVERKLGQLDFQNFAASSDLAANGVSAGNPDLKPDQRWQFELSYERRFWSKGSVVVTLTHEEIKDVVDYVPIITPDTYYDAPGNIGKGQADSLDIATNLPLDRFGLKGGLIKTTTTWRTSQVNDPFTGRERRISGERPDVIQVEFTQDLPRLKSTWGLTYFDGFEQANYRIDEVDDYHLRRDLSLSWDYKPRPDLSLQVELNDLIPYHYKRQRLLYDGPRGGAALAEAEYRDIKAQPYLFFRVRKTF